MFNPAPRIGITAIDARNVAVVLDDVLLDPDALVARAVAFAGAFAAPPHNAYPGLELPLPEIVTAQLEACFAQHARALVGARRTVRSHSRLSITACPPVELQPRQWLPHVGLALFELASLAMTDPTGRGDWHGDVDAIRASNMEDPDRKIHDGTPAVTPGVA